MQKNHLLGFLFSVTFLGLSAQSNPEVIISGRMRDVMWQGKLEASIRLDTLDLEHAYGLGPVAYLAGEILLLDGVAYRSTVVDANTMQVEPNFKGGAPFFGYAKIPEWKSQSLPAEVKTLAQLETYLNQLYPNDDRPFFFTIRGKVKEAVIHIVNLPEGTEVRSPDQAHQGLTKYPLQHVEADILGFYSRNHKAILTHHDTNMHLHLITADRSQMGHVDLLDIESGVLYLPLNNN